MSAWRRLELPTWGLLVLCYAGWGLSTTWIAGHALPLAILGVALSGALHSSLSHEVLHGHPTPWRRVNATLVFPALTLVVPYLRFEATHLAHHHEESLTDPYDDPETNFRDPAVWARLGPGMKLLLRFNNTLAGRMLVGPLLGTAGFVLRERRAASCGESAVLRGWLWHVPAVAVVALWQGYVSDLPLWGLIAGAYGALSILKIRTFLEHQAHERSSGRTVIVEDRGILSWLFLNNNLHVVHHMHPRRAWYDLPALYRKKQAHYQRRNGGYVYRNYAEIFRRYFCHVKDPVAHPLWRSPGE